MVFYIVVFSVVNLVLYWKQLKDDILTKWFKKKAFVTWLFFDILLILITALLILLFTFSYDQPELFANFLLFKISGVVILIAGTFLSALAAKQIGFLRSFSQSIFTRERYTLQKSGVFKYLKHPMYIGWFLIFSGATIIVNSLYLLCFTIEGGIYFIIRSKLEEKELEMLK